MADETYVGKGKVYLDGRYLGNVSKLTFGVTEEDKELPDSTSAGGGLYNSYSRVTAMEMAMVAHDFNADNLAMALYGDTAAVTAGAVTDEAQTTPSDVSTDVFMPTDELIDTTVAVNITGYVENTDYRAESGGIVVLAAGSIPASTALAISYTKLATDVVRALTQSAQEYELVFVGLNEAQGGKAVRVRVHRAKFGATSELSLIGDEFGEISLGGKVLKDTSIASPESQYVEIKKAAA
ncbi:MAG: hypothetical protein ABW066_06805 [Sedimenticola sp.]